MHIIHRNALLASLLSTLAGCATTPTPMTPCQGECFNGEGRMTYARNGQVEAGTYSKGIAVGTHTITMPDGRTLTAAMVNGVPHGPVRVRTASGQEYEQEWAHGYLVRGKTIHSNGDVFEGSYRTLITSGGPLTLPQEGTYLTAAGHRYQGRFERLDDRLVFRGSLTPAGQRASAALASAPLGASHSPLALTPLSAAELEVLRARHSVWSPAAATVATADPLGDKYFFDAMAQWQHQRGLSAGTPTAVATTSPAPAGSLAATLSAQAPGAAPAGAPAARASYNLIEGNTGKYMSPFTSDGVAAGWVDKAINAKLGGALGAAAGAYAGQKALEQVPFVGGFLGNKVGKAAGRSIALNAIGGEAYLRESSDISFNDINEMARWLVATHAQHTKFNEIIKAAYQIYPELQQAMLQAQVSRR